MIFSICEHVHTVCNILVASATDVKCPCGRHGKIKLLEFSVKGLQTRGHPYSTHTFPCGIRDILDSSVSINSQKLYMDIPGVCSEAIRPPSEVYGHCRKPPGSIEMVLGEGHGYEICLWIYTDIPGGV